MEFLYNQHKQLQALTAFTVEQRCRHHLRSHCDVCQTLHPPPVPQNFFAFQKREPASIYSHPCLYLERGDILYSEHPVLNLYMHSS